MAVAEDRLARLGAALGVSCPELAHCSFNLLGQGKDFVTCVVDGRILFRFPKRAGAAQKLLTELRLLPLLAPTLPLPIPDYRYSAAATAYFEWPFAGYDLLPGAPLTNYIPQIWDADWWPPAVGAFLTALHSFPLDRAIAAGVAPGTPQQWREQYRQLYDEVQQTLYAQLSPRQRTAISGFFTDYLDEPRHFEFAPVLLHGDVWSQHILVDEPQRRVTGIIDFADLRIGDPAFDIRNAWEPFYGGQQDATWPERRTFYYHVQPLFEATFTQRGIGLEDVNPTMLADALVGIARTWPP